ncbi:MAG: NAD(P)/FAD-dependent oxidoreductase [Pseudomonadota bacterium]
MDADAVVIGAGVVGLACARALAQRGLWVIVVEAAAAIGQGTSSRNSEVIHAGIYYPKDSLKAQLCVMGRRQLYRYAGEKGFEARALGKLIVASNSDEHADLEALMAKAIANDVESLEMLTGRQASALEPNLTCSAALHSPVSGVMDSHALMLALQGDLEESGGMVAFNTPVISAEIGGSSLRIAAGGDEPISVTTRVLINSAGLNAPAIARRIEGLDERHIPKSYLCKGNYFALSSSRAPFTKLIYPLPNEAGLGIHSTTDLGGQNRFGPDVEWIDAEVYEPTTHRLGEFEDSIRRYYPALATGDLVPDYAGIRPKIVGPGEPAADFVIQDETVHAVPGLVNLFGIESPGLTASLAIGDAVAEAVA